MSSTHPRGSGPGVPLENFEGLPLRSHLWFFLLALFHPGMRCATRGSICRYLYIEVHEFYVFAVFYVVGGTDTRHLSAKGNFWSPGTAVGYLPHRTAVW